jgi:hypothetical protein
MAAAREVWVAWQRQIQPPGDDGRAGAAVARIVFTDAHYDPAGRVRCEIALALADVLTLAEDPLTRRLPAVSTGHLQFLLYPTHCVRRARPHRGDGAAGVTAANLSAAGPGRA